jgi:LmbE family N-acetylglucosaminyl deacetylase
MGTIVCFHAHPDDEAIATGGTLARAVRDGHTVVLVVATGGEHGDVPVDLAPGESLADRRRKETEASCAVLGVQHLEWLGYEDSGMTGWDQNSRAAAFMNADLDEAAGRLAAIIEKYSATVLTTYDWHGNYGHPDHIMVHKVGYRAAAMAGITDIYEATMNRDAMRRLQAMAVETGLVSKEDAWDVDGPADDGNPMGLPESELTHRVDVSEFVDLKRKAIMQHASQMGDTSFLTRMPEEAFAIAFGAEWFRKAGDSAPLRDGWLFAS